jgi:ABC-type polysaccharide/polyol phosphate export permease
VSSEIDVYAIITRYENCANVLGLFCAIIFFVAKREVNSYDVLASPVCFICLSMFLFAEPQLIGLDPYI